MMEAILKFWLSPCSFALGGPKDFKIEGAAIIVLPTLVFLAVLFCGALTWVYRDAKRRNKNGFAVLAFVILFHWPLGWAGSFIAWLWLRPSLPAGRLEPVAPLLPPLP